MWIVLLCLGVQPESDGGGESRAAARTAVVQESDPWKESQHQIEVVGQELKSRQALAPRRVFSSSGQWVQVRWVTPGVRPLQFMRLRQEKQVLKTCRQLFQYQIIQISSLYFRSGHHLFALRKLVI